jgi:hypothetical protein
MKHIWLRFIGCKCYDSIGFRKMIPHIFGLEEEEEEDCEDCDCEDCEEEE